MLTNSLRRATSYEDVEAPFAATTVERPEAHRKVALCCAPVADADEYDVALIALNVLEVLHKKSLVRLCSEERLTGGFLATKDLNLGENGVHLSHAECRNAERQLQTVGLTKLFARVFHYSSRDCPRLSGIGARAAAIVRCIFEPTINKAHGFSFQIRAWKNDESVVIEQMIRDCNERVVTTPRKTVANCQR